MYFRYIFKEEMYLVVPSLPLYSVFLTSMQYLEMTPSVTLTYSHKHEFPTTSKEQQSKAALNEAYHNEATPFSSR